MGKLSPKSLDFQIIFILLFYFQILSLHSHPFLSEMAMKCLILCFLFLLNLRLHGDVVENVIKDTSLLSAMFYLVVVFGFPFLAVIQ